MSPLRVSFGAEETDQTTFHGDFIEVNTLETVTWCFVTLGFVTLRFKVVCFNVRDLGK